MIVGRLERIIQKLNEGVIFYIWYTELLVILQMIILKNY